MRAILATDGSPHAERAERLAGSLRWPRGTTLEVLRVDQVYSGDLELPPEAYAALHLALRREAEEHLARVKLSLAGEGRDVQTSVILGRPAGVILDEACRLGAELVIVGSHGRGWIESALVGSVAAEVVDHAPCPVLVARQPTLEGIVLADDGSATALLAAEAIMRLPVLAGVAVRVVSVADLSPLYGAATTSSEALIAPEEYQSIIDAVVAEQKRIAEERAARLSGAGVAATAEVRQGFVGRELIRAADESGANLIVVGSRGMTGIQRAILGSVARNVLFNARCSVLVVHPTHRARPPASST